MARKYGVSRAAVTMAVKAGLLLEDARGMIDEEHAGNAAWIARRASGGDAKSKPKREPVKKAERKPPAVAKAAKPDPGPKPVKHETEKPKAPTKPEAKPEEQQEGKLPKGRASDDSERPEDMGLLSIAKLRAEVRYKTEQADSALQRRLERLGELIDRELVRKGFAKLNQEIKTRFIELPARLTPAIVAMARAGESELDIQRFIELEISRDLTAIKTATEIL